jgi:hypothetical protein|tara:strand:+ start:284 stop:733 length:450 start_codon:yes stop_codon:yes gene_type:complete
MPTNRNKKDLLKNPEQIQQMIELLQTMLEQQEEDEPEPTPKKRTKKATKKKVSKRTSTSRSTNTTTSKKQPANDKPVNKFLSMPEANMYKEDKEIAKKLYKHPPVPRRRSAQSIRVKCRICGKEETTNPDLIWGGVERFKCNKCSSSSG